jgi:hypothetical protein
MSLKGRSAQSEIQSLFELGMITSLLLADIGTKLAPEVFIDPLRLESNLEAGSKSSLRYPSIHRFEWVWVRKTRGAAQHQWSYRRHSEITIGNEETLQPCRGL